MNGSGVAGTIKALVNEKGLRRVREITQKYERYT